MSGPVGFVRQVQTSEKKKPINSLSLTIDRHCKKVGPGLVTKGPYCEICEATRAKNKRDY